MKLFVYVAKDPCSDKGYATVRILGHSETDAGIMLRDHVKSENRTDLEFNLVNTLGLDAIRVLESDIEPL